MRTGLSLAVAGAGGRMGRQILRAALEAGHGVVGGSEAMGSPHLGVDLGVLAGLPPIGVVAAEDIIAAAKGAQVWIDFTRPAATLAALSRLPQLGVRAAIIGTTGFSEQEEAEIAAAANDLVIIKSGNFSLGIHVLQALVKKAASQLGPDWDIEILETHHRRKLDAPSGTALMLGEAAAEGRGESLSALRLPPYEGPSAARIAGGIGFAVRRSGGVIGEHQVSLTSDQEMLSLSHIALDRAVFAHGALRAAEWAISASPGLYGLDSVLGM